MLFVFIAALGADRHRVVLTLLLIASGVLTAALLRVRFAQPPRTTLGRSRHPLSIALPAAVLAGTTVVLGVWFLGPRLPGAGDEALIETHNDQGGVTEVLSPLLDIRSRLVNRSDTELFEMRATEPAYWRALGLASFDGTMWTLPNRTLEDAGNELSVAAPGTRENRQELVIRALGGELVPAAAEPVAASPSDGLRWNAETAALLRTDRDLEPGDRYEIVSAMPRYTADLLRGATTANPPDAIYLQLPDSFPDSVATTAAAVTAGAPTSYDAMLTLQNWFHDEFEYSLDVPAGHSTSAIEAFLRQRVGYCEQFAGTFAAMARSLNIPARVAVGYTQGLDQGDGTRSVLGRNSHAWPEIWFDGVGWVMFEPTPGRGAPGAESHTGLPAAQDDAAPQPGAPGRSPGRRRRTLRRSASRRRSTIPSPHSAARRPSRSAARRSPHPGRVWGLMGVLVALLAGGLALPAIVRRWRRHHPSADIARQVSDLWRRALGALEATGFRVDPSLTPNEQARAAAPRLPVAARPLKELAAVATAATYAPPDEVAGLAAQPHPGEPGPTRWCRQIEHIAADSMTTGGRIRRYFTVWT